MRFIVDITSREKPMTSTSKETLAMENNTRFLAQRVEYYIRKDFSQADLDLLTDIDCVIGFYHSGYDWFYDLDLQRGEIRVCAEEFMAKRYSCERAAKVWSRVCYVWLTTLIDMVKNPTKFKQFAGYRSSVKGGKGMNYTTSFKNWFRCKLNFSI